MNVCRMRNNSERYDCEWLAVLRPMTITKGLFYSLHINEKLLTVDRDKKKEKKQAKPIYITERVSKA